MSRIRHPTAIRTTPWIQKGTVGYAMDACDKSIVKGHCRLCGCKLVTVASIRRGNVCQHCYVVPECPSCRKPVKSMRLIRGVCTQCYQKMKHDEYRRQQNIHLTTAESGGILLS